MSTTMAALDRPPRRRRAVDWDKGRAAFPGMDDPAEKWAALLTDKPDVLWNIVADIVKVAKAAEGPRRSGRRPIASGLTFEEVWSTLHPERFTLEPFADALRALISARFGSQRAFAPRLPWHQTTLSRLLSGRLTPDLQTLEIVAAALKIPPSYFVEYRAYKLGAFIAEVLTAHPHLSITVFKRLARDGVR